MNERDVEIWAGVECARVRVGDRVRDQLELTGHAWRAEDIDRLAALGVAAVRYPVLWDRIAPRGVGEADWRWADERLGRLRAHGLRPVVGLLHHGVGIPGATYLDDAFPEAFGDYALAVARRYPWIHTWLPINEPLTTARFAGLYGVWWPHARDRRIFVRILLNQLLAVRTAVERIRAVIPGAIFLQNEDLGRTFGTSALRAQVRADNARRWLTFDLLTGRVPPEHDLADALAGDARARTMLRDLQDRPCPPDLLGLDYYVTSDRWLDERVTQYPAWARGGNGRQQYADVEVVRVGGRRFRGINGAIREAWARYRLPIALAEVHLGGEPRDQVSWWEEALAAVRRQQRAGADIRAVTAWAAFGAQDWSSLMREERGDYEPGAYDVRCRPPALTPVGEAIRAAAAGAWPEPPRRGWWRRPARAVYGSADGATARRSAASRPRSGTGVERAAVAPRATERTRAARDAGESLPGSSRGIDEDPAA